QGLLGAHQARREDQVLDPPFPDQPDETIESCSRKAVAECAGNRKPELHVPCGNPQVAAGRDGSASARARSCNGGNGRHWAGLDCCHDPVGVLFISDALLRRAKISKQRDVSARGERAVTGTSDDDGCDRSVRRRAGADFCQPVVHAKGQGVPSLRPVEGHEPDSIANLIDDLIRACYGLFRPIHLNLIVFHACRSFPVSSAQANRLALRKAIAFNTVCRAITELGDEPSRTSASRGLPLQSRSRDLCPTPPSGLQQPWNRKLFPKCP